MSSKILLADDSVTIQKVVELTFSDSDYEVTCVGDGTEVLDQVRSLRPDVVLLDVILPGENGYDLCDAIKNDPALSDIPVLLLTGTFEPFDRRRAEAVGADGHLTKPFESQVLISRVAELRQRGRRGKVAEQAAGGDVVHAADEAALRPPLLPVPPPAPAPAPSSRGSLSDEEVDRIARRVAERLGEEIVREVAWEVVPDLAERLVRQRIREIEEEAE